MFALLLQPWSSVLTLALMPSRKTNSSVLIQNRSLGLILNSTTTEAVGCQLKALAIFRDVVSECFPFDPQNQDSGGGIAANWGEEV